MDSTIAQLVSDVKPCAVGVAFRDLVSGATLDIDADRSFHAASTMKVPVMLEAFRQADQGRFSLDDGLLVRNRFISIADGSTYALDPADDSETTLYEAIGTEVPIRALIEPMIAVSSNLATNILIERLGIENIQALMSQLQAEGMKVVRGVEDKAAYRMGMNNTATPRAFVNLMNHLASRNDPHGVEMIEIMRRQQFNEAIPSRLPAGCQVAHKTGWNTGVYHDAGWVTGPQGQSFLLAVYTAGSIPKEEAEVFVAQVASECYAQAACQ